MASLTEIERHYRERQAGKHQRYGGAYIEFKRITEFDPIATEKRPDGLPQYKVFDIIEVSRPGGDITPVRVEEWHKKEYPLQWEAFKAGVEQPLDGTPLEQWPMISIEAIGQFKHYGIRTVEVLSGLPDEKKKALGPLGVWVKKAQVWLESAQSDQAATTALKVKIANLEKSNAKYEEQLTLLLQRIDASEGNNLSQHVKKIFNDDLGDDFLTEGGPSTKKKSFSQNKVQEN